MGQRHTGHNLNLFHRSIASSGAFGLPLADGFNSSLAGTLTVAAVPATTGINIIEPTPCQDLGGAAGSSESLGDVLNLSMRLRQSSF
jgi:hypothetical protein